MVAGEESVCELNDWLCEKLKRETNLCAPNGASRRIGVALIGLGRMGMVHLRNLLREPRAKLLYCVDSDRTTLAACSKSMYFRELGVRALHGDQLDVALADINVHAVIIATPSQFHEEQTRRALSAAKSVMCEKPLTQRVDSITQLFELARTNKVFLLAAFNRRYDPDLRHVNRCVRRGSLGSIQTIRVTSRDYKPPPLEYVRHSGGMFHDTCVHDIDLCIWLMRQLPESVHVIGKTWRQHYATELQQLAQLSAHDRELLATQIDDHFLVVITLRFANGSIGILENARQGPCGYEQSCEVNGSHGALKCGPVRAHATVELNATGQHASTLHSGFASRYSESYVNELQDLLTMAELSESGSVQDERELRKHLLEPVRASLALATYTVANACKQAAKSDQTVVFNWSDEFVRQFELEIEL